MTGTNAVRDLPDKDLLRPDEVAEYFRISVKTVRRWIKKGTLASIKVNNIVRVPRSAAIALLKSRSGLMQEPDDLETS